MDDTDREESEIAHPRAVTAFFGHREAEAAILDAYRGGRIPHAWLIGGPEGIGKATLAYRAARFVFANPDPSSPAVQAANSLAVSPDHPIAGRIAAQGHPDLLTLERTIGDNGKLRTVVSVEQIRRTVPFFGSTAGEGGWRVVIVDSIDELNESGENALLKLLEEPPPRALLFLISHAPGRVRATLRSRCRRLTLRPLSAEEAAQAAASATSRPPTDAQLREAAAKADGRVARAIALLDGDALKFREQIGTLLGQLPDVDGRALHALADGLTAADQTAFETLMDILNDWLSAQLAADNPDKRRFAAVAEAWERINRAAREAEAYNLDRKPVIFTMFSHLAEAARH